MFDQIPALYWMLLIGALSGFFAFIMYQFAMLLADLRKTVQEATITVAKSNSMLDDAKLVVESAKNIVSTVEGTVTQLNETVLAPVKKLAGMLGVVNGFMSGLKGKSEDSEE
ncbi:MAG: hypothetical protein Fur003_3300 [Candidatus Dojkabacteria bacterium]